ncbi:MAG: hypothetical protein CMN50_03525 [SAR116 cluster bacterium]|nr:hypothetical protein [SAR116 cluster bacterium]|tara:strand:- start:385 stop:1560 length:1176 start_codon:yes stop_codon:yes gene_type:complete
MTQHKVISEDSLSAMDEISKVLGKDAVILSTKKLNGKIEIIGSNDITDILKSQKNTKISSEKLKFKELFTKQPIEQNKKKSYEKNNNVKKIENSPTEFTKINEESQKDNINFDIMNGFKSEIKTLLNNMIITDIDCVSNSLDKSLYLKLLRKGFSKQIINSTFKKLESLEMPKNEINFYKLISKKLVFPSKEKINESDVIFVTGFTGVGKTTLSSKIVSYLLDNKTYMNETKNISLINFSNKSANNMTDLINFGRLLNVKVHSLSNINDLKKFLDANRNRKLIVDVSREFIMNEDFMNFLEDSSEKINYSLILTIQANANRRTISDQMDLFRNLQPIIALTKLDESYLGSEELSIFAEINSKIGLLSSSKNIIDALAFAKDEILAQYMKEM